MNRDFDHRVEAEEAMRKAAAATTAIERIKWLQVALAWQDLERGSKDEDAACGQWSTNKPDRYRR